MDATQAQIGKTTSVSSSTPDDTKTDTPVVVTSDGTRRGKKTHYGKHLSFRVSDATLTYIDGIRATRGLSSRSATARALLDDQAESLTRRVAKARGTDAATLNAFRAELQATRDEVARLTTQVQKAGITINKKARAVHIADMKRIEREGRDFVRDEDSEMIRLDVREAKDALEAATKILHTIEARLAKATP